MRTVLLLLVLMACTSNEPDPHELGECGSWSALVTRPLHCELACRDQPSNFAGSGPDVACLGHHPSGNIAECNRSFDLEGTRGCCVPSDTTGEPQIWFYSCDAASP